MKNYHYTTCCINSTAEFINAMVDNARRVTLRTIQKHCEGLAEWADSMGYCRGGLTLNRDWSVSYWKSKYRGKPCYYIDHSSIEYIWILENEFSCTLED
jgi:hypothetical protein